MGPGQTVIVLAGDYLERIQVTRSGASGSPITFKAQGTVTMRGFTVKADHISIIGFDISNTPDDWQDGVGIFLQGSSCNIEDNYVHFATRGGIALYAAPESRADTSDCVVRNNRLYRNAMAGIELAGRDHLIEGNEIWGTIQYHPNWSNPPSWVDADGMRFFGSGHTIRQNYIHDISFDDPENVNPHIDCFQTWGHSGQEPATNIVFEQNHCEALTSQAIHENGHGFMLADASNLIIRNNIIEAYGGVNTGGGGNHHLTIVNNVFANDLAFQLYPGGVGLDNSPNSIVKNNIFYDQPHETINVLGNTQGNDIDFNLAFRSDGQPSRCYMVDYACVDPAPMHDLWNVDPEFENPEEADFRLRQNSPAIDAGASLAQVTTDYDGNRRPQGSAYDIGAFEFSQ
jgi:hypothetical protein